MVYPCVAWILMRVFYYYTVFGGDPKLIKIGGGPGATGPAPPPRKSGPGQNEKFNFL